MKWLQLPWWVIWYCSSITDRLHADLLLSRLASIRIRRPLFSLPACKGRLQRTTFNSIAHIEFCRSHRIAYRHGMWARTHTSAWIQKRNSTIRRILEQILVIFVVRSHFYLVKCNRLSANNWITEENEKTIPFVDAHTPVDRLCCRLQHCTGTFCARFRIVNGCVEYIIEQFYSLLLAYFQRCVVYLFAKPN